MKSLCGIPRFPSLAMATAITWLTVVGISPLAGQPPACNLQGFICNYLQPGVPDPNCTKLPTSLAIANGLAANTNPGWSANGSACGYNYQTRKSCGDKLSTACCNCSSVIIYNPCEVDPTYCSGGGGGGDDPCVTPRDERGCANDLIQPPAGGVASRLATMSQMALPQGAAQILSAVVQVRSVHLVASARLSVRDHDNARSAFVQSTASYEYWESGRSYRIRTAVDPKLGFIDVPELAFDGRRHQMMLGTGPANSVLSVHLGDERSVPAPLDNPIFLAMAFFSPEDSESCPGCELRLSDLRYLARLRTSLPDPPQIASSEPAALAMPNDGRSNRAGHPAISHHLRLDASGHVVSIQDVDEAGSTLRQIDLADFQPIDGAGFELPRSVTLSKSLGSGSPWLVVRYKIETLEINKTIAPSTFDLSSLPQVHKIWNSDVNGYLKYERVPGDTVCPKNSAGH